MTERPRDQWLKIRISQEDLKRLHMSALSRGESLTRFMIKAGFERGERSSNQTALKSFRNALEEAVKGGRFGYKEVGFQAALGLRELLKKQGRGSIIKKRGSVIKKIRELFKILDRGSRKSLLVWFEEQLPSVIDKIPRRRRDQFLEGVWKAVEQDLLM